MNKTRGQLAPEAQTLTSVLCPPPLPLDIQEFIDPFFLQERIKFYDFEDDIRGGWLGYFDFRLCSALHKSTTGK